MRFWMVILGAAAAVLAGAPMGWAQDEESSTLESAEPAATDTNIFESIQLKLLDLDELRREIASKLSGEPMQITLDQCVQMALQSNQDILIVGYESALAGAQLMGARGQFDPALNLRAQHSDSERPASSQILAFTGGAAATIESKQQDYSLTIGGQTQIGTQYDVGFAVNRERGTFTTRRDEDGNIIAVESVYTADLTLNITQPLLRGVGTRANLVRVRTAKNQQKIANEQIQFQLLNTIGQVVKSYWDLVGAIEQVKVQQEALDNASRVLRINEQRFELGTASALEVANAKAGVAVRQSDLITARTAVFNAQDVLKTLIGLYDESGELLSRNELIPIEGPNVHDVDWDVEASMRTAIERRPDVLAAGYQVENAELEAKRARNDLLPQFDLQGSYGRGTIRLDGTEIFEGIGEPDGRSFTIGGIFSLPLGNRTARGNYAQAKLITRQQEQRLIKTKQDAMLDVSLAIQALASNRILVESTKQTRILEEVNVDAEEKRLVIGVTTAQNVLDRQEDLTAAQAREVNAQVDFEKSLIDLQVAEGTLLEEMGIVYEVPEYDETLTYWQSLGRVE